MTSRIPRVTLALLFTLAACSDLQEVTQPTPDLLETASQLGDASNPESGVEGIYFFPPLAETPVIPEGDLPNGNLATTLVACAVGPWSDAYPADSNGDGYRDEAGGFAACDDLSIPAGETSDPVYSLESGLYQGSWRTPEPEDEIPFRLLVLTSSSDGDVVLGLVDAWIGDTGGGSTSNSLPGYIRLNRGSNNPVKFHAGFGTICGIEGLVDCAFGILGSTNNQNPGITTPEGKANVIVCQDGEDGFCVEEVLNNGQGVPFLAYRDEERLLGNGGVCIPGLTLPQYAEASNGTEDGYGCYFFQVFDLDGLDVDFQFPEGTSGFASMCIPFDAIDEELLDQIVLIKQDEDGNIIRLPRVAPPASYDALLAGADPCGEYDDDHHHAFESSFENPVLRLADRGWNALRGTVRDLVTPEPLYAYFFLHQGIGGELKGFSHVTPALGATFDAASPSEVAAPINTPVDSENLPTTSVYYEAAATNVGIAGVEVTYAYESYTGPGSPDFEICGTSAADCVTEGDLPDNASLTLVTDVDGLSALHSLQFNSAGTYVISASVIGGCPVGQPDCDGNQKIFYTFTVCGPGSGTGTAFIDGEATSAGEWACAVGMEFEANVSGGSTPAEWWFMSDDTNLYMLVRVLREPDDKVNRLRVDFDADGVMPYRSEGDNVVQMDGTEPAGSQFADWYLTRKCIKSSQANCGEPDAPADQDGEGAFGDYASTSPYFVYEFSFPLDSADDWGASPEVIRAFITIAQGGGAQGNTQILGFDDYSCVVWTQNGSGLGCPGYDTPADWPLPSDSN